MENKHYKLHITGRVQGVWYRASSHAKALELDLTGFVRNNPDGSVYAEIEGPQEALEAFVEWAKNGPAHAEVREVKVEEGDPVGFFEFEVRR